MRMRDLEKMTLTAKRDLLSALRNFEFAKHIIDMELARAKAIQQEILDRHKLQASESTDTEISGLA